MDTLKLIIEGELNNLTTHFYCPQKNKLGFYLRKIALKGKKIFIIIEIRTTRKKPACNRQAQKPNKIKGSRVMKCIERTF